MVADCGQEVIARKERNKPDICVNLVKYLLFVGMGEIASMLNYIKVMNLDITFPLLASETKLV